MDKDHVSTENNVIRRRDFIKASAAAAAAGFIIPEEASAQTYSGSNNFCGAPIPPGAPAPWNVPQRPGPPLSIDVHSHWAPEAYLKILADIGRPDQATPLNFDMDKRQTTMEASSIKMSVLTLGGFMPWQWVTPEQGARLAQVTNDAAVEVHTAYPKSFVAAIEVPAGDPIGTLKEINRVAGKSGLVAVHLPNSLAGREYLFEPEFAPVLARCEELNLPIILHPLDGEPNWYAGHRLADQYSGFTPPRPPASRFPGLTNQLGDPFEQATTLSKLIMNGTLDKYPKLQFVANHAGGALPYLIGRVDFRSTTKLERPIREYMRRFYFDSLTFYPVIMRFLVELVGSDRVVLGTDYAYNETPRGQQQPHSVIDQANLPELDRDLILHGNLTKLFRL